MGLTKNVFFASLFLFPGLLIASPKLRLSASTIGPISIASGGNGNPQVIEAYNIGDGSLSLTLSSSASWLSGTASAQRACTTRAGLCTPLNIALNTAGLPAGTTTGILTVADPNAVDAPQTITVTVQIGGSVPSSVDLYVAAGGSNQITFSTNSPLTAATRTNDGTNWLSVALDGLGSFRFSYPYRLKLSPPASMAPGQYSGTVTTSGSTFPADNKTIGVTMRVTSSPVAIPSTERVQVRLAQGAPAVSTAVALNNSGSGALTIGSVTSTGGSWLTTTAYAGGAILKLTPGDLAVGKYTGTVTIASNAANGSITVPVEFEVVAKGNPLIRYQGVVDNGTFGAGDAVNGGDVVVVLGEQLSFSELTVGQAPPLATTIGGAKVLVNGVEAPMYYSSYGQLAFQMPYNTPAGSAEVQVVRDGLSSNKVSVDVTGRAPKLLLIGVGSYGAIVNQDGSIPMPTGSFPGVNTHPAKAGDVLTLYAIGLGPTSPQPASGAPAPAAEPFARLTSTPTVKFGGGIGSDTVTPLFAALTPTYAGLYQVNVQIPSTAPKGTVAVTLIFGDSVSNSVDIVIQ